MEGAICYLHDMKIGHQAKKKGSHLVAIMMIDLRLIILIKCQPK